MKYLLDRLPDGPNHFLCASIRHLCVLSDGLSMDSVRLRICSGLIIVFLKDEIPQVLLLIHGSMGHSDVRTMRKFEGDLYWWLIVHPDVTEYFKSYDP